ncbi:PEP-CTERM sorting domain-containing protein [Paludisphaera borealis]|uniref:PEP-CTERM protein-sorting domain-containing protein n=1 Tax=Paludisphaera borealis TaxID=1387353 RepID=A0A1U7CWH9_9BACT|nr:PEP-CTERM sorting domain-containing protein [Paludisphaera borealis]APW63310.1 hypothetical protein BSF38_04874 [Paludisphaera borealis]
MFLALAASVIATFALAAPTQASYITTVTIADNTSLPANGLDTTWSGVGGPITDVQLLTPAGVTGVIGTDTVHLAFNNPLVAGGIVTFSFVSATAPISFVSGTWAITLAGRDATVDVNPSLDGLLFSTVPIAVPEPESMSLLIVGLSGLLGLRNWTKRRAKAAQA